MKKPVRKCGECIHYCACSSWNVGTILQMDASHCVNFEGTSKCGNWRFSYTIDAKDYYVCSNCNRTTQIPRYVGGYLYDFCPNCGASMERGEEDD